jgi:hypothetical protein
VYLHCSTCDGDFGDDSHCQVPIRYHYPRPRPRVPLLIQTHRVVMNVHGHMQNDVIRSYLKKDCESDRKLYLRGSCSLPPRPSSTLVKSFGRHEHPAAYLLLNMIPLFAQSLSQWSPDLLSHVHVCDRQLLQSWFIPVSGSSLVFESFVALPARIARGLVREIFLLDHIPLQALSFAS